MNLCRGGDVLLTVHRHPDGLLAWRLADKRIGLRNHL